MPGAAPAHGERRHDRGLQRRHPPVRLILENMCSYCGCRELSLIGRYMAEHEEIVNRCGDLRRAVEADDAEAVDRTRVHLADLLTPHTVSEERSLFAVLREDEMFTHEVDSLCSEHTALCRTDRRLPSAQGWASRTSSPRSTRAVA